MLRLSQIVCMLLLFVCWQIYIWPAAHRSNAETTKQTRDERNLPQRMDTQHLPNAVRVHSKVISGGTPEGDAGFKELHSMGVRTIVSVDGKKPEVESAKKYGLRYVHLPHGYDGIPQLRVKELAKGTRSLDGSIYIHCHHGKHRSPAAAAVACIAAGELAPADGLKVLELAGTSPEYRDLFKAVRHVEPIDETELLEFSIEFHETVDVPPMAEAMVAIEQTHDRLKAVEAARWKAPTDHPDLDPVHEALLLREHFSELLRLDSEWLRNKEFKQLLQESAQAAQRLEKELHERESVGTAPHRADSFSRHFARIGANCKSCHQQFRDVSRGQEQLQR